MAPLKKTIVIFGVSSFVGSNLAEFLKDDFHVIGTFYKTPVYMAGVTTLYCNVTVKEEVQLVIYTFKPHYSIYAAGVTSLLDCSLAPEYANSINTVGLFNVSEYCQRYKSQLIFISSGYVFGGVDKVYVESDIPDSLTLYGKTKASAEFFIQRTSLNYLIFRCSNLYGRSLNPRTLTFFEGVQEKFVKGENFICDDNVYGGFVDVYYLAQIMKMCWGNEVINRMFQISSRDHLTHYGFVEKYCKVFNTPFSNITKGHWYFPILSSSASNYSGGKIYYKLDISNIESYLNIELPTVEDSLGFTFKRFHGGAEAAIGKKSSEIEFI